MARPRQFDEDQVLQSALDVFWEHGYEATSVADLMEATGLAKASLYNGLGDKRTVFLRALERFMADGRRDLQDLAAGEGSGLSLLRLWLARIVEMATCRGVRKGCLMVNSAVELAPHDDEIRSLLARNQRAIEGSYVRLIERGKEDGSLRRDVDSASAAQWLTTCVYGLQVRSKMGLTRAQAEAAVDLALSSLIHP